MVHFSCSLIFESNHLHESIGIYREVNVVSFRVGWIMYEIGTSSFLHCFFQQSHTGLKMIDGAVSSLKL